MYHVQLLADVPDSDGAAVFAALTDFARFPELTSAVHSVSVEQRLGSTRTSSWEVDFADGVLRWRERDHADARLLRLDFTLLDGDLPELSGTWAVHPAPSHCTVEFEARFDLGVPGMADVLEPVAGQALTGTVLAVLHGVFGDRITLSSRVEGPVREAHHALG